MVASYFQKSPPLLSKAAAGAEDAVNANESTTEHTSANLAFEFMVAPSRESPFPEIDSNPRTYTFVVEIALMTPESTSVDSLEELFYPNPRKY
jgi:hypothetical protein